MIDDPIALLEAVRREARDPGAAAPDADALTILQQAHNEYLAAHGSNVVPIRKPKEPTECPSSPEPTPVA